MTAYPVRVEGHLTTPLSRWLWLVKWILAIPHYVILAFLWVTFAVLTVFAFFAILFTGRYPRAVFDFNVGVLRWSWRVAFYTYSALGTDRYPPFTLEDVPDYPARFQVEYPERLSQGLVLVKWWLLAIPHYAVVAFFVGWGGYSWWNWYSWGWIHALGLIGVLVLIAAVVLLFTDKYPGAIFDFVLGMNRWVLRVAAYATLMTDRYPPFRMDTGGTDPEGPAGAEPPVSTPSESPAGAAGVPTPSVGRIVAAVVGALLILGSATMGAIGGAALWTESHRDADGFVNTGTAQFDTNTYAIRFDTGNISASRSMSSGEPTEVRVRAESEVPVFVGIGPASEVSAYLSGVAHAQVQDLGDDGYGGDYDRYRYREGYQIVPGDQAPQPPASQGFWVASASGSGEQSLTWNVQPGQWSVVVLNADGSRVVDADLSAGAKVPGLIGLGIGLLLGALVAVIVGALLIFWGLRPRPTHTPGPPTGT